MPEVGDNADRQRLQELQDELAKAEKVLERAGALAMGNG